MLCEMKFIVVNEQKVLQVEHAVFTLLVFSATAQMEWERKLTRSTRGSLHLTVPLWPGCQSQQGVATKPFPMNLIGGLKPASHLDSHPNSIHYPISLTLIHSL